jgi:hypothetical protein
VRCGDNFPHKASLLIPAEFAEIKRGAAKAPVQELRDRSYALSPTILLRGPQVFISSEVKANCNFLST